MSANNQGIVHLRLTPYGAWPARIACSQQRAHMAQTLDDFRREKSQCKRCAAWLQKVDARAAVRGGVK